MQKKYGVENKMIDQYFTEEYLKEYYLDHIKGKVNVGVDRINKGTFENKIFDNIRIINSKVLKGTYRFSKYKGVMIPKRPDKNPRTIAISTIRDKIVLSIVKDILSKQLPNIRQELVQTIISDIKNAMTNGIYDAFIKIDIKDFFPSISHDKLKQKLQVYNVDKRVIKVIDRAITGEIVFDGFIDTAYKIKKKGVPQGLPISNILAEIYLYDFDCNCNNKQFCRPFRYVDDILVLCKANDVMRIMNNMKSELEGNLSLEVHDGKDAKTITGLLEDGFEFLGYKYTGKEFSVRSSTVNKLEKSIERIFLEHRKNDYVNIKQFIWQLNLRITGAIIESKKVDLLGIPIKKKYGWVFFFSQIEDKKLLFQLDTFVQKMINRFKVSDRIKAAGQIKKFVKTYHEVLYNRYATEYIPNFSKYSLDRKKAILEEVFNKDTKEMKSNDIEICFNRMIFKSVRNLEEDVQDFS